MTGLLRIGEEECEASIAALGAELISWRVGGQEMMWQRDPAFWSRSAPILFPTVGRSHENAIRVGGKSYPMPVHGFAPGSHFAVDGADERRIVFTLSDAETTRQFYPFSFRLTVEFEAGPDSITVRTRTENTGDTPMPYAIGLHPGFIWPDRDAAGVAAFVTFDRDESPSVPIITPDGFFDDRTRPLQFDGRSMPLTPENLGDEAVCFIDARSRRIVFERPDGSAIVVENGDFPHFAIWTREGAGFLSIESWTGHGAPAGFDGEFTDRPSIRVLMPDEQAEHSACYSYRAAKHG